MSKSVFRLTRTITRTGEESVWAFYADAKTAKAKARSLSRISKSASYTVDQVAKLPAGADICISVSA